ncbi:MAG: hypothetical protein JWO67_221 [Streptosporangiaceae bacterium]|jgi:TPR repeat protein|nr:hypothetical protein [Streptosporangiaceae bacterium]
MPVRRRTPAPSALPAVAGEPPARVAYGLGAQCERDGDLAGATRWLRHAAEGGSAEAALRLGDLLGRLAEERGQGRRNASEPLLAEATRWLSTAKSSTAPDAVELVTDMLNRHQRLAARRGLEPVLTG